MEKLDARKLGAIEMEIVDFIFYENKLLDSERYDEWYELFAEDGVYWIPGSSQQTDPENEISIALENKLLLRLRIERLAHQRAFSLQPQVKGLRLVQNPCVLNADITLGLIQVETNIIYSEYQADRTDIYPASVIYYLQPKQQSWEIVQKKVNLLAVDGHLPCIQLFV